jgi:formylmethanofuran dehydrogenase subunit B
MTAADSRLSTDTAPWTCPFCALLCDDLAVRSRPGDDTLEVVGTGCPRAQSAIRAFPATPAPAAPSVDGRLATFDEAVAVAARWLATSRQPLFAGLGTDVAGARALYPLACETGAICDPEGGRALMHLQRTLQDHGGFTTTLAEVRTRADLVVFVGGVPAQAAPRLWERCGLDGDAVPGRQVVVLGGGSELPAQAEPVPLAGDLFDTVALLGALVAGRALVAEPPPGLVALAARLRAARYAVFIGALADLPPHGALIVEDLHRTIGLLNQHTRAAALWVGAGAGAGTVNPAFTWLSGLPLRSRVAPAGLEHEPLLFDTAHLLARQAVDALLWVSSFGTPPPEAGLPRIVLGPPALGAQVAGPGVVFLPVATPGIGAAGHLFRADGRVVMPLFAARPDTLPSVAEVVGSLRRAHAAQRASLRAEAPA